MESVMRLIELGTIYLAVGASFGVNSYLHATARKRRRRAIFEGLAVALLWPLAAAAILWERMRHTEDGTATDEMEARRRRQAERVEDARRAFVISVNKMLEDVRALLPAGRDAIEPVLYALRETVEQYVGLALVVGEVDEAARPAPSEMELARLSGRRGHDLQVAGRCVHRRNVARIRAHYERERSRLLHKLAELRGEEKTAPASSRDDAFQIELRRMTEARLEIYLRAADLFSLLDEMDAARSSARLIDAECAALRRILEIRGAEGSSASIAPGEKRCTEQHAQPLIYKDPLRATTFTQG